MSRTYRKLTTKRGKPRRGKSRFNALQIAHCDQQPKPYTVKSGIYEEYEYTQTLSSPIKDRIYVPKGTPLAKAEMGEVIRTYTYRNGDESSWKEIRPTGRYFFEPPAKTITKTLKKYLGPNPEYDSELSTQVWMQRWAFRHHRKNYTGARCSNGHRRDKHSKVKAIRLDGNSAVHEAMLDFQHMQSGHNTELCEYLWFCEPEEQEEIDWSIFDHDDWLREPWGYTKGPKFEKYLNQ